MADETGATARGGDDAQARARRPSLGRDLIEERGPVEEVIEIVGQDDRVLAEGDVVGTAVADQRAGVRPRDGSRTLAARETKRQHRLAARDRAIDRREKRLRPPDHLYDETDDAGGGTGREELRVGRPVRHGRTAGR